MNDRTKLAEAMGWDNFIDGNDGHKWGIDPKAPPFDGSVQYMPHSRIPDPFTDANDCDQLKQWLRDRGWHIEIRWQAHTNLCPAPAVYVEIWHEASEIHHRFDSDIGEPHTVSTAALKVIE